MFDLCIGFLLAGLLAHLVLPPVAEHQPTVRSIFGAAVSSRRMRTGRSAVESALQRHWTANEFAFGHAIEAYEDLIDNTVEKVR